MNKRKSIYTTEDNAALDIARIGLYHNKCTKFQSIGWPK